MPLAVEDAPVQNIANEAAFTEPTSIFGLGPFVAVPVDNPNQLPSIPTGDDASKLVPGPFPGVTIDPYDMIKIFMKSKNPSIAYDTQIINYLVATLQYFGTTAVFKSPSNQFHLVKYAQQYHNAILVLQQWASFKQTSLNDKSLATSLSQIQVSQNLAPSIDDTSFNVANLNLERRALLRLAGGSRVGRGGRGSGRGRGRGRYATAIADA